MISGSITSQGILAGDPVNLQFPSFSFKKMLEGPQPFYNSADYEKNKVRDFAQTETLPVSYTWNTENRIVRIAKKILSIIIFPVGIYKLLHSIAGIIILPASQNNGNVSSKRYAQIVREDIGVFENEWKYKRITVEMDGYKIDAMIVGKATTLSNRRWVLVSNGNGEYYEEKIFAGREIKSLLSEIDGNALFFNYPGVGASTGVPNRQAMANAYRAMLHLLEDKQNGIGAKEIIGYGHSLGGGVQGDALKTHSFNKEIKYVFVKSRTFSNLSATVSNILSKSLGIVVKILGWNMDTVESSKRLRAPEIVLQCSNVDDYKEFSTAEDSSNLVHDTVISANVSLARALLVDDHCEKTHKKIIGINDYHNDPLSNIPYVARTINSFLETQGQPS